jgi:hypothetical protein
MRAHAARLQRLQHVPVLRKGGQVPVLVHQTVFGGGVHGKAQPLRGKAQTRAREVPERHVAAAHRHEPRVVDLLVAPQRGQGVAAAREQLLGQQPDAVDVEQRAIGVEENGARSVHRAGHCIANLRAH